MTAADPKRSGMGIAGISATQNGFLVCDLMGTKVVQVDSRFQTIREWNVVHPSNAKADSFGNFYAVTFEGDFVRLLPSLEVKISISGLDAPFDFAFAGASGPSKVWISEQGKTAGKVSLWSISPTEPATRSLNTSFAWANPEGMLYSEGLLWVLDTELGQLVRVDPKGNATIALDDLGIPILIRERENQFFVYSNQYRGAPAVLTIER